jgi:hypothetical protein
MYVHSPKVEKSECPSIREWTDTLPGVGTRKPLTSAKPRMLLSIIIDRNEILYSRLCDFISMPLWKR